MITVPVTAYLLRFPLVLFRTPFFDLSPWDQVVGLEVRGDFIFGQERLRDADAVVFNSREISWAEFDVTPKRPTNNS